VPRSIIGWFIVCWSAFLLARLSSACCCCRSIVNRRPSSCGGACAAVAHGCDAIAGRYQLFVAAGTLAAISLGASSMGALTYVGNAPNLMIYALAVERGIAMPSFFAFMAWSGAVLLPVFALVGWVFFG
jgi:di/tricarboxylate transporter